MEIDVKRCLILISSILQVFNYDLIIKPVHLIFPTAKLEAQ